MRRALFWVPLVLVAALLAPPLGAQDLTHCVNDVVGFRSDSVKFAGYAANARSLSERAMTARVHEACASATTQRSFTAVLAELQRIIASSGGRVDTVFRVDTVRIRDSTPVVSPPPSPPPPPPPASGSNPAPNAGSVILIDTRAGGPHSIQVATSFADALYRGDPFGYRNAYNGTWGWATNIDGAGTKAFRLQHTAVGTNFGDRGGLLSFGLRTAPVPSPKEVYVQFKHRMGRTQSDVGGFGAVGAFDIANENDPVGNAGRKYLLLCRPYAHDPGGCGGRADHTHSGPSPAGVGVSVVHANGFDRAMGTNVEPVNLEALINTVITVTTYVRAASSDNASDGIIRLWYNGKLVANHENLRIGAEGVAGLGIPTVFRSPRFDMSEYFWDLLVWTPGG